MAGLYFQVGADFSKLNRLRRDIDSLKANLKDMDQAANPKEFARLEKQLKQLSIEFDREAIAAQRASLATKRSGESAASAASDFDKLKRASLIVGGTTGLLALGKEVINVRGEIESLEKSFDVLLGGKDKAAAFIASMKEITLKSNYSLTNLAGGAQTLLGFNVDEKQIIPVLEQIGNIAMGNKDRFNSLTLAFAQMSSTGKLMGQDLLQMINAGFNPLQVIAEKTGKTMIQVKEDMSNGAISSEMVAAAFKSAATEGGKFAGMLESQADGIKGAEAILTKAIQDVQNELGQSNEDLIKGGYRVTASLIKNYKTIGEVLTGLIATYGLYKAALLTVSVIEKQKLVYNKLIAEFIPLETALRKGATAAMIQEAAAARALDTMKGNLINTTKSLFKAMLPNPYVLAAAAVVALGYGIYKLSTATSVQEQVQESLNKVMDEAKKKKDELSSKTNDLTGTVNSETKTIFDQITAYKQLQGLYPSLLRDMDIHTFKALGVTEQQKLLNAAINEVDFTNQEAKLLELNSLYDRFLTAKSSGDGWAAVLARSDIESALDMSFWDKSSKNANEILEILRQTISGLEKEKALRQENLKEAEFQAKPETERKKIIEEQLAVLKQQEDVLINSIIKTGEYKRNIDGTISPVSDIEKKFNNITDLLDNWNKNPFAIKNAFESANPALNTLLSKLRSLNEEKGKLEGKITADIIPVVNKSTLEKQVSDFKNFTNNIAPDLLEKLKSGKSITPSLISTSVEEFNRLKELENQYKSLGAAATSAVKDLKIYEDPKKDAASTGTKGESAAEKARKEAQKAVDEQLKLDNEKVKAGFELRNALLQNDQALLDQQDDSFNKQQKQIELNHKKELLSIEKYTQELIEKEQERERKLFDIQNPKGSDTPFKPQTVSMAQLPETYQAILINRDKLANGQREKETGDLLKSLLEKYQDYNTQRAKINKAFDAEEKALNQSRNSENAAEIDSALAVIVKKRKEAIKAINNEEANETKKTSDLFVRLFTDASQQSVKQIRKVIDETQALHNYLTNTKDEDITANFGFTEEQLKAFKGDADQLKAILDGLIAKKQQLAGKSETESFMLGIEEGLAKIKKGGVNNIGQGITDIGNAINTIMPSIEKMGQDLGTIFGGNTADDIGVITELLGATAEVGTGVGKIMSGDVVGGLKDVISGTAKVFTMAKEANKRHREALELIRENIKAEEHAYNLALMLRDLNAESTSGIFGTDEWKKASVAADVYKRAILEGKKALNELNNVKVATGHEKTGLFGWGKGKDTYTELLKLYPQLINAEGKLDAEKAKSILTSQKMSETDKTRLQNAIDYAEMEKQAFADMQDYLTGIFGDLGNTILDTFVDAFKGGKDAMSNFYDSASDMLANLVKSFINSMRIAPIMKKATDEAMAIMDRTDLTDEQKNKKLLDVTGKFIDDVMSGGDAVYSDLEYWGNYIKEKTGKNPFEKDSSSSTSSQSSSKGGFETMNQDQTGEFSGRLAGVLEAELRTAENTLTISNDIKAMMGQTFQMSESIKQQITIQEEIRNIQINGYFELKDINKNTKELYEMNERLGKIENNTKGLIK